MERTRTRGWARPIGLLLASVLALVAWSGPPAAAAASVTVRLTDRVSPSELTIAPGTTVVFRNDSGNRHRMRSVEHSGDRGFDTGNIEPGERASVTFRTTGSWPFVDDRERDDAAFHGLITVRDGRSSADGGTGGGTGGSGGATVPSSASVDIGDRVFRPSTVTISAGGRVTWRNGDSDEHTASARDGSWDSGVKAPGASWSQTFATAGSFGYLCLLHPEMTGTVVVRAASGGGSVPAPAQPRPVAPPPDPTPPPQPAAPPAVRSTVPVAIQDNRFAPETTRVTSGTSIRWTNAGAAIHTVTDGGGAFDSGLLRAGQSFETTTGSPGTYAYSCIVHPGMTATLVVVPGPAQADAPAASPAPPDAAPEARAPEDPRLAAGGPGGGVPEEPATNGAPGTEPAAGTTAGTTAVAASTSDAVGARLALVALLVGAAALVFARLVGRAVTPG